ncbi:MAG: HNH endonuclease [Planctomycetes bacterium]|nr:HNH endonuclease [Planctomycetota bacterium]
MNDRADLRQRFRSIKTWKSGDQRAPHKPLLLLMALAEVQRGGDRYLTFESIRDRFKALSAEFGHPNRPGRLDYPFWRLLNDGGLWEIPEREQIATFGKGINKSGDVSQKALLENRARGGFSESVYQQLHADGDLVNDIVGQILDGQFPTSLHAAILDAVGMPWVMTGRARQEAERNPRSANFRPTMIRLYEHRCAMCGFECRLGGADLGLEAAHIKWHAAHGPDSPDNGLLLCSIHHLALDRGAVGISEDRRILVSQHLYGGSGSDQWIVDLTNQPLRMPIDQTAAPASEFIAWHQEEVFRRPQR